MGLKSFVPRSSIHPSPSQCDISQLTTNIHFLFLNPFPHLSPRLLLPQTSYTDHHGSQKLGLIVLCPPVTIPARYLAISAHQLTINAISLHSHPFIRYPASSHTPPTTTSHTIACVTQFSTDPLPFVSTFIIPFAQYSQIFAFFIIFIGIHKYFTFSQIYSK